ncbi:MAG: hypothetical protein ACLVDB_03380 [Anaeromassilibacillus sp.]
MKLNRSTTVGEIKTESNNKQTAIKTEEKIGQKEKKLPPFSPLFSPLHPPYYLTPYNPPERKEKIPPGAPRWAHVRGE